MGRLADPSAAPLRVPLGAEVAALHQPAPTLQPHTHIFNVAHRAGREQLHIEAEDRSRAGFSIFNFRFAIYESTVVDFRVSIFEFLRQQDGSPTISRFHFRPRRRTPRSVPRADA